MPDAIINTLETEEDLEAALEEQNIVEIYEEAGDSQGKTEAGICSECDVPVYSESGREIGDTILCALCARGKELSAVRDDCFRRQKTEAEKWSLSPKNDSHLCKSAMK